MWNWLKDNGTGLIALAAILTVILTSTNSIHHRLDAQDRYIDQRFDAVDRRFEAVDRRFDAVDQRFNRIENELSTLRGLIVGISERVSRNEGQIDVIREQIQAVDTPTP